MLSSIFARRQGPCLNQKKGDITMNTKIKNYILQSVMLMGDYFYNLNR